MSSRSMRWTARAGVLALAVGVGAPAAWAATWAPPPSPTAAKTFGAISDNYSWNYGSALGKLSNGKIVTGFISDATTPEGMFVRTGTVGAADAVSWGTPKRISPAAKNVDRPSLSTGISNNNIYASYVTQTKYALDPTQPRQLFIRTFTAGAWQPAVPLSSKTGRVDYPVLSSTGNTVYSAFTNSNSGQVALRVSTNAGASFGAVKSAGTTTRIDPDDLGTNLAAWPGVCSAGTNVAVPYLSNNNTLKYSISKDSGATWAVKSATLSTSAGTDNGWGTCDATGNRIGFSWNQNDGVYYAEYNTSNNSFTTPATKVFGVPGGGYNAAYGIQPALDGASTVGLAAPLCVQDGCDYNSKATRIDLNWLESSNNGGAFGSPELLGQASTTIQGGRTLNDSPSALWYDSNTRFVVYNGWDATAYKNYRLYLSTGQG